MLRHIDFGRTHFQVMGKPEHRSGGPSVAGQCSNSNRNSLNFLHKHTTPAVGTATTPTNSLAASVIGLSTHTAISRFLLSGTVVVLDRLHDGGMPTGNCLNQLLPAVLLRGFTAD